MRSDIHEQIDKNLKLLVSSRNMTMYYSDMLDSDNHKFNQQNGLHFVSFLVKYNLITNEGERCDITPKGVKISENGGWLEYRRRKQKEKNNLQNSAEYREQLELRNLELQNSNVEYRKDK